MAKVFAGKETDANWEAREKTVLQLRALIQQKSTEWRVSLAKGLHDLTDAITKAVTIGHAHYTRLELTP